MKIGDLEQLEDLTVWDRLLARSPQKTRFLDRKFLDIFEVPVRYYGLFKKGVCVAGLPIIDASRFGGSSLPWCYYQGPIFFDEIYRSSASKLTQYEIELSEEALTQLAQHEDQFSFSLNPTITDVRGFDWVHYHHKTLPRCSINPRYTAVLEVINLTRDEVRAQARSARRQEEGYAISREELGVRKTTDSGALLALYEMTFDKQNKSVSQIEISCFRWYCDYLLKNDLGIVLEVYDQNDRAVAATLIFKDYDDTWHVPIVGVGDTRYGGTLLYFYIVDTVMELGGRAIDFNGANSPQRAYFKHSLGAKPVLYFEVDYTNSS